MTNAELLDTMRRLVSEALSKGHAHMVLAVSRPKARRPRRSPNIAIARGLIGRWVGDLQDREGYIVDVLVSDAVAWLQRRGVRGQEGATT